MNASVAGTGEIDEVLEFVGTAAASEFAVVNVGCALAARNLGEDLALAPATRLQFQDGAVLIEELALAFRLGDERNAL